MPSNNKKYVSRHLIVLMSRRIVVLLISCLQTYITVDLSSLGNSCHPIVQLAREYGRYGYRRITAMLRLKGYVANRKRVYRIWRELGLKVPKKQPKRRHLWLNGGSCIHNDCLFSTKC